MNSSNNNKSNTKNQPRPLCIWREYGEQNEKFCEYDTIVAMNIAYVSLNHVKMAISNIRHSTMFGIFFIYFLFFSTATSHFFFFSQFSLSLVSFFVCNFVDELCVLWLYFSLKIAFDSTTKFSEQLYIFGWQLFFFSDFE